jgi:hypothetical protein
MERQLLVSARKAITIEDKNAPVHSEVLFSSTNETTLIQHVVLYIN